MAENIPGRSRRDLQRTGSAPPEKPPAGLSKRARGIWQEITTDWLIDASARPVLRIALEQLDTYDLAQKRLKTEGLTVQNGGMLRAHPCAKIAQDALGSFRQCFRQLGLEPPAA
jgi:phage terminase small subunit